MTEQAIGREWKMARVGRERKPGKRAPSGQLSREGRSAAEALSPAMLGLLKNEVVRSLHDPLWGSQLGMMNLKGQISVPELEAGKRWGNLARRYQSVLGARGIQPVTLERLGASCDYDPDSREGQELVAAEKRICDDFEAALRVLVDTGRQAQYAVRLICEEDAVLTWEQRQHAKCGLSALADHWGLTNQGPARRK